MWRAWTWKFTRKDTLSYHRWNFWNWIDWKFFNKCKKLSISICSWNACYKTKSEGFKDKKYSWKVERNWWSCKNFKTQNQELLRVSFYYRLKITIIKIKNSGFLKAKKSHYKFRQSFEHWLSWFWIQSTSWLCWWILWRTWRDWEKNNWSWNEFRKIIGNLQIGWIKRFRWGWRVV